MKLRNLLYVAAALAAAGSTAGFTMSPDEEDQPVIVKAQPEEGLVTRRVGYADLNLTMASDQKVLSRRVGGAVRKVCLEANGPNMLDWAEVSCRQDAWRGAKPQIALAVKRAHELAATGFSSIAPVAIQISISAR